MGLPSTTTTKKTNTASKKKEYTINGVPLALKAPYSNDTIQSLGNQAYKRNASLVVTEDDIKNIPSSVIKQSRDRINANTEKYKKELAEQKEKEARKNAWKTAGLQIAQLGNPTVSFKTNDEKLNANNVRNSVSPVATGTIPFLQNAITDKIKEMSTRKERLAEIDVEIDKWLDSSYKMTDDEVRKAKEVIKDYKKNEYKNPMLYDMTDEEIQAQQEKFEKMIALENKTNLGASIMGGIVDAMPFSDVMGEWIDKASGTTQYADAMKNAQTQNPLAYGGGYLGGTMAEYALGSKLMTSLPVAGQALGKAGESLSKIPVLGKVGADHITNVLGDTTLDVALDTIPQLVSNVKDGKTVGQVASEAAKNVGTNLAYNVGGEALGVGFDYLQKSKQTKKMLEEIANEIPTINKTANNATMDQFSNLNPLQYGNVGNTASMVKTADDVTNIPLGNAKADVTPNYASMEYSEIPYVKNQDAKNLLDSTVDRIKKDTDYALKTFKDGTDRTELVAQANKALDDFAMNPTDENYLNIIATRNKLNDSMQGTKYKSKRYKTVSVYDNDIARTFNAEADKLYKSATDAYGNVDSIPRLDRSMYPQQTTPYEYEIPVLKGTKNVTDASKNVEELAKNMESAKTEIPTLRANSQYKTSKVRSNTMENSGIANEKELANNFKELDYQYRVLSEEESLKTADDIIATYGDRATDSIIENGITHSTEIDVAMKQWSNLIEESRKLEAQGLDGSALMNKADRLMRQVRKAGTENGQTIQAFAKWTRTPEGVIKATQDAVSEKNIAKVGSKKYESVMNVSDTMSDIFNGSTYDEALQMIGKAQKENPKVSGYATMRQLVNECKKNNLALTEENLAQVLKNNPNFATEEMRQLLAQGKTTISAGDIIKSLNKVKGLSTETQKRILDIVQTVHDFDINSTELQTAVDMINKEISKEFPMSKWDKFVEASHVAMLCSLRTNIRNTLANVALLPQQAMSNKLSAVMQNCYAKFNADFTPTQAVHVSADSKKLAKEYFAKEITSSDMMKGKYSGETLAKDPLKQIGNREAFTMKREYNIPSQIPILGSAGKVVKKGLNKVSEKAVGQSIFDNLSAKNSMMENIRNFTYDMLELGDSPFVKANYTQRLASAIEAENKARLKNGIEPIKSIADVPDEFAQLAFDTAMKATFKDDNCLTNLFMGAKRIPVLGESSLPFGKTPANIVMRSIDYSPVGSISSLAQGIKSGDVAKGIDGLTQGLTGTGVATMGVVLASSGVLIGSLATDADMAQFQKQQGIQPFSISTKGLSDMLERLTGQQIDLGDTYITLDWAQPASANLMVGAEMYKVLESGENPFDADNIANTMFDCAKAWGDTIISNSTLSNIQAIFDTSYNQTPMGNIVDNILEMPLRLLPAQLNQIAKSTDLQQRQTYDASSKLNTLKNQALSKTPWTKDSLPQAYDTWGNEKVHTKDTASAFFNNLINPSNTSVATTTPIDSEIERLYNATGNSAVFPRKTDWTLAGNKLDNVAYSEAQKNIGQLSYELAENFINSDAYKTMSDADRAETLGNIYSYAESNYLNSEYGKDFSSTSAKYHEMYDFGGADAVSEYINYKSVMDSVGLSDDDKMRDIWNNDGADGIRFYSDLKEKSTKVSENGNKSIDKTLLYNNLASYDMMTDEEKGYYYYNLAGKNDTLTKIVSDWGFAEVFYYAQYKQEADAPGVKSGTKNGQISGKEAINYLNQQNMTADERRYWYSILAPSDEQNKNPY